MTAPAAGTARVSRIVVAVVAFFVAFNFTVDRYWVTHAHDLPARAHTDLFARMFQSYAVADRGYFDKVGETELALEEVNSTLTQALTILLLVALLRRWPLRVPLQIGIGTYVSYSVLFDWWSAFVAGLPGMDERTVGHVALFISANVPWVLGHGFIAYDGIRTARAALNRRNEPMPHTVSQELPPDFPGARNLRQRARAAGLSPNHWYAVAQENAVRCGTIHATRFQGEPIAIFRGSDGALHAVEDRCRHRGVALSLGEVAGCALVCPYHGWTYNGDGRLVHIPHELFGREMPRLQLRTYPLRTRYGLIWLFPGEPALADATAMPEIPELEGSARWACIPLEFEWQAHHSIIIDNLSDLSHGHLHRRYEPFADPVLVRHEARGDAVHCFYRITLLTSPFMRRLLDRTAAMEQMELCFQYPYQWGNTGGSIKHWVFLTPLDATSTKVIFMFYFNRVRIPFTAWHVPQRLMGWVLRVFHPIFVRPVVAQDGEAVAWEQAGFETHHGRSPIELNPAVPMFQELVVRKWREYLSGLTPA